MYGLLRSGVGLAVWGALLCPSGFGQNTQSKGIPPRAAPAEYQAHAQAGTVTVAAELTGHSIATTQSVLSTEDYVAVEVALFGPADARVTISRADFSLRIDGKKTPLPAQPYAMVFESLKDPEWAPPEPTEPHSKTSLNGSGRGQSDPGAPAPPVRVPIEIQRGWQQGVQKTALPEGDRALPQAGLIFFRHSGKTERHLIELLYAGPAGKATLTLQK